MPAVRKSPCGRPSGRLVAVREPQLVTGDRPLPAASPVPRNALHGRLPGPRAAARLSKRSHLSNCSPGCGSGGAAGHLTTIEEASPPTGDGALAETRGPRRPQLRGLRAAGPASPTATTWTAGPRRSSLASSACRARRSSACSSGPAWSGIVDIHIEAPPWLHLDLEASLREAFGLTDVIVAPPHEDARSRREGVARYAARYLERRLRNGSTVAVSHGRDTGEVPRFFRPGRHIDVTFASAMGGSPRVDTPTNPNEICQALATRCGGRALDLYAPAYVESAEMRDRLLAQEAVAHTLGQAARADVALVGIGGMDDDCTMVRSGCLSLEEIARLRDQGAVGDVLGNYVDFGRPGDLSAPQQPAGRAVDRAAPPDRDRRRRRERGGEAAGDRGRPPGRRRRRAGDRRGQRPRRPRPGGCGRGRAVRPGRPQVDRPSARRADRATGSRQSSRAAPGSPARDRPHAGSTERG